MPLVELVRVIVRLRVVVVELYLLRFLFGSSTSALALSRWTQRGAILRPRRAEIAVRFIQIEFLAPLQRIVLRSGLDNLRHCVVLLLVSSALRRLLVADSAVYLLLLAITALVLLDLSCDFGCRVLGQVRIADKLELKEVPHGLLKLRFDLRSDVTAALDSLLERYRYWIQVFVNWVDWLRCLVKCSQLLFTHMHHGIILVHVVSPWVVVAAAAVWELIIIEGIRTAHVATSVIARIAVGVRRWVAGARPAVPIPVTLRRAVLVWVRTVL